jgi:DNA polymerase III subunit epsilon
MREIVLDTETTGLDPGQDHRVVEIGCLELVGHIPTGRHYHTYLNPERAMPSAAEEVHGLSDVFLAQHPTFAAIADALMEFLGDSALVIHNAAFDLGFLNAELARLQRPPLDGRPIVDTVTLARQKFPGLPASLDALCRRFGIDRSGRVKHGALVDAQLLSAVYLELIGGRQPDLSLAAAPVAETTQRATLAPRAHQPTAAEAAAHAAFIQRLKRPLWTQ